MRIWRSAMATQAVRLGVRSLAGFEAADVNDLILGLDSDGEGAGSAVQNGIGAAIEQLEWWNDAATTVLDEEGREELGWQLAGQLRARIVPKQGKGRNIQSLIKSLIIESIEISSPCKNSLGNLIGAPKIASAEERPVSRKD